MSFHGLVDDMKVIDDDDDDDRLNLSLGSPHCPIILSQIFDSDNMTKKIS